MKRVAKPAGRFNVVIEEAPVPEPQADEVRVRAVRSLISRGSEIGARYTREHAIDPERMGYSLAGVIDEVGSDIQHLRVGDRVVYAVGGPAGPKAFDQGLDMLAVGGLLHLIGLYEDQPLPLSSGKIQRRRLLGGYYRQIVNPGCARRAMELLASGAIRADRMTSHRFPYRDAAAAFDLLYNRPGEAMGVLLDWEAE